MKTDFKKLLPYAFLVVLVLVIALVVIKSMGPKPTELTPKKTVVPTSAPVRVPPTNTPQEKEILQKMETKEINVSDKEISPAVLTIKAHDQVIFWNKTAQKMKVVGQGWGGFDIAPQENMVQRFDNVGTIPYTISGLSASLSGSVVVK